MNARRAAGALAWLGLLAAACDTTTGPQHPPAPGTITTPATDAATGPADPDTAVTESRPAGETVGSDEPLPRETVVLYFPSALRDGLVPEEGEIFATASPVDRAKQILSDLISGPNLGYAVPALPPGTRLRQVYVVGDGTAYADFAGDLLRGLGGGSCRELLAVFSIVDSLVYNIPEVRRVGILIDGRPIATLNGHIDLSRPLPPDDTLVLDPPSDDEWDEDQVVRRNVGEASPESGARPVHRIGLASRARAADRPHGSAAEAASPIRGTRA